MPQNRFHIITLAATIVGLSAFSQSAFSQSLFTDEHDALVKKQVVEVLNIRIAGGQLFEVYSRALFDKYVWLKGDLADDEKYAAGMKQLRLEPSEGYSLDIAIDSNSGKEYLVLKRAERLNRRVCEIELSNDPIEDALDQAMKSVADLIVDEQGVQEASAERRCVFESTFGNAVQASLIEAAKEGNAPVIEALLRTAVGLDSVDSSSSHRTALHWAVANGHKEATEVLIAGGADVNFTDDDNRSPLLLAVRSANREIVEALVAGGADVHIKEIRYNATNGLIRVIMDRMGYEDDDWISAAEEIIQFLGNNGLSIKEELDLLAADKYSDKREEIIYLASLMSPLPDVGEEARRKAIEGATAFKHASNTQGFEEAKRHLQEAADLAPWWPDAYYNLGLVLEKLRQFDEARDNFEHYVLAAPEANDLETVREKIYELEYLEERTQEAGKHINAGVDFYNGGNDQEAASEYRKAVEIDPEFGLAHAYLGLAYGRLDRQKEAIVELKEGLRLGAKEAFVYSELGRNYYNLGDRKEAINILAEGAIEDWNSPGGSNGGGLLHQRLGRYYEEEGDYEKALTHFSSAWIYRVIDADVNEAWVVEMIDKLKTRLGKK